MASHADVNGAPATNGAANGDVMTTNGDSGAPFSVKAGLAQMLKGGVIMDVVNAEQVRAYTVTSISG